MWVARHMDAANGPPARNIGLHGMYDKDIPLIAVLSQLCCKADIPAAVPGNHVPGSRLRLARDFLAQFTGKWALRRHTWGSSDIRGTSEDGWGTSVALTKSRREDVVFQYHMRVFTTQSGVRRVCPALERISGDLTIAGDTKRNIDIHEIRYSVGLKTTWEFDLPVFSLVTMADSFTGLDDLGQLWDTNIWTAVNIRPSIRATGVAAFAFRIRSLLPGWAAQWSRLLDEIDRVLSADVSGLPSSLFYY